MTIEETMKAYIAGLFDGEGTVYIYKTEPLSARNMINPTYTLACNLSNTNHSALALLKELFGGTISLRSLSEISIKSSWQWSIASKKALAFLEVVYPYLRIKKQEAEEAILFQKYMTRTRRFCRGRGHFRPKCEVLILGGFYQSLKDMKKQDADYPIVDFSKEKERVDKQFQLSLN